MNKKIKKVLTSLFAGLMLITLTALPAFAGNGGGQGTGSEKDIPFTFTASSVKNGETNVPLNPAIDLEFNKNVVNIAVKGNNSKCFHLVNNKGKSSAIKIIFPDDQLRQEYKQHIFIEPVQNLAKNTKYTLYIDRTLRAKNLNSIDDAHIVTFTTGTSPTAAVGASLKDLGGDVSVYTNELPPTKDSYLKKITTASAASVPVNTSNLSIIIIAVAAVVVLVFAFFLFTGVFLKKRNRQNKK